MTTYARIVDGYAIDVVVTPPELAQRFHPDWLSRQTFVVVPDGTKAGATDNGNGTYTNPVAPVPVQVDKVLARVDLINHLITQLGGNQRFGAVIAAAKTATDSGVAGFYEQYTALPAVTKAQAQAFLTAIRAAGLPSGAQLTVAEIAAVVTNWPQQPQG